jgi:hypothetical protein
LVCSGDHSGGRSLGLHDKSLRSFGHLLTGDGRWANREGDHLVLPQALLCPPLALLLLPLALLRPPLALLLLPLALLCAPQLLPLLLAP